MKWNKKKHQSILRWFMLVDLAALCRARPTGNSSERNQTKEDELGISSGPLLTLALLLEGCVITQIYAADTFTVQLFNRTPRILYPDVSWFCCSIKCLLSSSGHSCRIGWCSAGLRALYDTERHLVTCYSCWHFMIYHIIHHEEELCCHYVK